MSSRPSPSNQAAPILAGDSALFLDFDGTLAPLQDDADAVALPVGGADSLLELAGELGGALILISGRSIHDLSSRTPRALWRAGGHGGEVCAPGQAPGPNVEQAPEALRAAVQNTLNDACGARLEPKGKVLAVHYRQNPNLGPNLFEQLQHLIQDFPSYRIQHGKMVIELKPSGTDKGTALQALMQMDPFKGRTPVMVGDDTTDEDAMAAAIDLGGIGIKVGAGETCAQYRFADTEAVWDWLKRSANEHA